MLRSDEVLDPVVDLIAVVVRGVFDPVQVGVRVIHLADEQVVEQGCPVEHAAEPVGMVESLELVAIDDIPREARAIRNGEPPFQEVREDRLRSGRDDPVPEPFGLRLVRGRIRRARPSGSLEAVPEDLHPNPQRCEH